MKEAVRRASRVTRADQELKSYYSQENCIFTLGFTQNNLQRMKFYKADSSDPDTPFFTELYCLFLESLFSHHTLAAICHSHLFEIHSIPQSASWHTASTDHQIEQKYRTLNCNSLVVNYQNA